MPLEPALLFSRQLLEVAIPERLAQTGISGRQFAYLLIHLYQAMSYNNFRALERGQELSTKACSRSTPKSLCAFCENHFPAPYTLPISERYDRSEASHAWGITNLRQEIVKRAQRGW